MESKHLEFCKMSKFAYQVYCQLHLFIVPFDYQKHTRFHIQACIKEKNFDIVYWIFRYFTDILNRIMWVLITRALQK